MESSTYCFALREDGTSLQHIYWGARISSEAAAEMARPPGSLGKTHHAGPPPIPFESETGISREEYAPWGEMRFGEADLKVEYADGTRTIEWVFEQYGIERAGPEQALWLRFRDRIYSLVVTLSYRIHEGHDVIERRVQLENAGGSGPIVIEQAFSADWRVPRRGFYRLTYLQGRWGKETQVTQSILSPGKVVLESRRGMTSHQFNPWLALDPKASATEESGAVWSAALAWSGSWKIVVETTPYGEVHCAGGVNDFDFRYMLQEGEQLELPIFAGLYSHEGFGGASRAWHAYEREVVLPEGPEAARPVLYNSWEATSFDVNERNQMELAAKAAALGAEVFVVDDGWFGARNNERAGLGDWTVNREKFPHGLNPLIERVNALEMRFGLWIEPEMVNPDSDLYRAHPDWVYHFCNRSRTEGRNQLVLNLAREDVRDWMLATLDSLLSGHHIEFIKWDINRSFSEPGWPEKADENSRRVWLDHVRNLYWIIDELRRRHPDVDFESCAGGGGRVDLGILSRVEQVWTSDNTDAFDRLSIQEGFSYAYTPRVMMAWVTDVPNFVTGRSVPLRYRFHVAMSGSLGIGGDLSHWTPQEMEEARAYIALYKRVRSTIQNGLLYRLRSPREGNVAASEYVAQDGSEVVVFAWGHSQQFGETQVTFRLHGLQQEAEYINENDPTTYSGAYLARQGLSINLIGDYDSQMIHLVRATPGQDAPAIVPPQKVY
ncbi:MAG TPA: alpha-galactosidase [Ktedonobacteraceae bacterium]|nr:alpha-galactosidase [Ktedonobacteraceae bacterium]